MHENRLGRGTAGEMLQATARIGLRIVVCDRWSPYKASVRARRDRTEGLTLEVGGRRSNGERHRGVDRGGPVAGEGGLPDCRAEKDVSL